MKNLLEVVTLVKLLSFCFRVNFWNEGMTTMTTWSLIASLPATSSSNTAKSLCRSITSSNKSKNRSFAADRFVGGEAVGKIYYRKMWDVVSKKESPSYCWQWLQHHEQNVRWCFLRPSYHLAHLDTLSPLFQFPSPSALREDSRQSEHMESSQQLRQWNSSNWHSYPIL